ncbi:MAG TPA: hypothetical protein VIB48_01195 [Acidimicrobiia bacterium]|jgi:hypothetical protein
MLTTRGRSVDRRVGRSTGCRSTGAVAGYLEALDARAVHRARTLSGGEAGAAERSPSAEDREVRRLEHGFVAYARTYAVAHGIEYATWREFGVPAEVLVRAGIRPDR